MSYLQPKSDRLDIPTAGKEAVSEGEFTKLLYSDTFALSCLYPPHTLSLKKEETILLASYLSVVNLPWPPPQPKLLIEIDYHGVFYIFFSSHTYQILQIQAVYFQTI